MTPFRLACLMLLLPLAAQAQPVVLNAAPMRTCPPTAAIPTRNYPGAEAIPTLNALDLPAGKAVAAEGERILLIGRVLDAACVPVLDASVEIWQNDPYGRWILANGEDLVSAGPVFAGAGRTYTRNNGEFHFITLFPAAIDNRAPNFNIKISAPGLHDFSTVLYFEGDERNHADPLLARLTPVGQQTVNIRVDEGQGAMLSGRIDIVLPGRVKYRGY